MENYEYPTDEELERIEKWDAFKDPMGLVEYVKSLWWVPDWGFKLYRGRSRLFGWRCWKLQLHTGGWSGNEDIIGSLHRNFTFWQSWQKEHWHRTFRGLLSPWAA